jgi:hypothetical protein
MRHEKLFVIASGVENANIANAYVSRLTTSRESESQATVHNNLAWKKAKNRGEEEKLKRASIFYGANLEARAKEYEK